MELENTMKVKSLCLPILAENPFAKGDKEKELITAIALEDEGISDVPEESDADDLRKHENVKVQYERALAYIRELTNHTFLRSERSTSRVVTKRRSNTRKSSRPSCSSTQATS